MNKKAIIYIRVSSEEQVKGTSLKDQEIKCREYCQQNELDVIAVFRDEGASAKSIDRKDFLRAIEYCRKNKKNIAAFVVTKVDRFARNTEDHFYVRKLLMDYGTTLHSVTEPIGDSPIGKLVETVLAGTSEFDNSIRKIRCSDGMIRRIKDGIYPWMPPLGYLCANFKKQDLKKTECDKPDPERFHIIQRLLKYVLETGEVSPNKLAELVFSWGLTLRNGKRISPQQIDRILSHIFYAGIILNPFDNTQEVGQHKPMITPEEFEKIQLMRKGKYKHFYIKKNKDNPEFPLNGTLKCLYCGIGLTGSFSKGKTKRHPYQHCHNKNCEFYGKTIPRDVAHADFIKLLEAITPKEEFLKLFEAIVNDVWKNNKALFENSTKEHTKALEELKKKKFEYVEMMRKLTISEEFGKELIAQTDNEILVKGISLSESRIETLNLDTAISYATNFIKDLPRVWIDLPVDQKKKFQQLVFPEGISYSKKERVGTHKLGLIYELNQKLLAENSQNQTLVDPSGFEPLTSSVQMRRSTN